MEGEECRLQNSWAFRNDLRAKFFVAEKMNSLLMLNVYREEVDNLDMNAILSGDEKRENAFRPYPSISSRPNS